MIGRLTRMLRGRRRRPAPVLEDRLAALERAVGVKMEAQLVVLAQALAEVITRELARQRRVELVAARDGVGQGVGRGAVMVRPAGKPAAERTPTASLLDRTATARPSGARP